MFLKLCKISLEARIASLTICSIEYSCVLLISEEVLFCDAGSQESLSTRPAGFGETATTDAAV